MILGPLLQQREVKGLRGTMFMLKMPHTYKKSKSDIQRIYEYLSESQQWVPECKHTRRLYRLDIRYNADRGNFTLQANAEDALNT